MEYAIKLSSSLPEVTVKALGVIRSLCILESVCFFLLGSAGLSGSHMG